MKRKLFSILIIGVILCMGKTTSAQQGAAPQMFVTWRTNTYIPHDYPGKALPGSISPLVVSFELLDGGRFANLSKQIIYWYVDNELRSNKPGVQSIRLRANDVRGGEQTVRIELPDYQNRTIIKTIEIPTVAPEAVIESAYADGFFSGLSLHFKAKPFFFNAVPGLFTYSWSVNGEAPAGEENPDELSVSLSSDTPSDASLSVLLEIENSRNSRESAGTGITLKRAR